MSKNHWRSFKGSIEHKGKVYTLKGQIHLKRGTFPGEVEIDSINGIPSHQIMPGMPEIPYTDNLQHLLILPIRAVAASFTQKMDGTAILFSPLQLPDGEIAVFPRTRGTVVIIDTKWRPLRTLVNSALNDELLDKIATVCRQQNATLVFELWGSHNQHTVQYDNPLNLSLHTMIKGRNTTQPWRLVKQIAGAYQIPVVEELGRIAPPKLTEENLLHLGEKLVAEQEKQNDPLLGLYRYEGVVLNVETRSLGFQWKLKPPSMEEYHRSARANICPITVFHSLWKMVDRAENVSLSALIENMALEYGTETVSDKQSLIAHQYSMWLHKYYDLNAEVFA